MTAPVGPSRSPPQLSSDSRAAPVIVVIPGDRASLGLVQAITPEVLNHRTLGVHDPPEFVILFFLLREEAEVEKGVPYKLSLLVLDEVWPDHLLHYCPRRPSATKSESPGSSGPDELVPSASQRPLL